MNFREISNAEKFLLFFDNFLLTTAYLYDMLGL